MSRTVIDILRELELHRADMERVSLAIHAKPELMFEEHHAVSVLTTWLAEAGFAIVCPAGGLDTAFVARHHGGRPGPTIAVLMEYDALPELGHGCGHNLIAAGGALAAIVAVSAAADHAGTRSPATGPDRRSSRLSGPPECRRIRPVADRRG
jgi:metal-dependent amidase/aminoacylase/carboxypeptidase family protein